MDANTFITELLNSQLYNNDTDVRNLIDIAIPKIEAESRNTENLRDEVADLGHKIKSLLRARPNTLEKKAKEWIEEIVKNGYQEARETVLLILDITKDEKPPSEEEIKKALLTQLTGEQIAELIKLREPVLLIVPDTNIERLETAINKPACKNQGTLRNQLNADIRPWFKDVISKTLQYFGVNNEENITKYRFAIVEGAQNFNGTDALEPWNKQEKIRNDKRIADFEAHYAGKGIQSMNAHAYMVLMMRSLRVGKPTDMIDDDNVQFTLITGEPKNIHIQGENLTAAGWMGHEPSFGGMHKEAETPTGRLRPAVMGEIES